MKRFFYILVILFMSLSLLSGREISQQDDYQKAVAFEKSGEYTKAESLYVNLYNANPNNYNYFSRYKNMLIQQRKYETLLPLIQDKAKQRNYDNYIKLELGVLNFALENRVEARKLWTAVLKDQQSNTRRSYAISIYQDVIEYGLGNSFYLIVDDLRKITADQTLLVNYNFSNSLRYRNWEQAVKEILHILDTDPQNLKIVRSSLFRYDPLSALYQRAIEGLTEVESAPGRELLSEIYTHVGDHRSAFEALSTKTNDPDIHTAMQKFANRMFKIQDYDISLKAAEWTEKFHHNDDLKISMALLAARSKEQKFYENISSSSIISEPYSALFTEIRFKAFDKEESKLIESAYRQYDSLSVFSGLIGTMAAMRHADISYRIYQDFDGSLQEYLSLVENANTQTRRELISRIADLYMAKGQVEKAYDFIRSAPSTYRLMVHEEDQLLPQAFFISVLSGVKDSLNQRAMQVLAMLPTDDPLYNDVLSYAALLTIVSKDSLNYPSWLNAERLLLQNNIASAAKVYQNLLSQRSSALHIYALRYLDCLTGLNDKENEAIFWKDHYEDLLETEMGDYFMIRYAEFLEKMQKFQLSIEIFEKYLLSYQESMYYENIREYVRQHYSLGTP
jgi:hypothetical protein